MKRLLFILGCISTFVCISAAPLVYKGSNPASGSEISSWDIEMEFDISEALKESQSSDPDSKFGLGYTSISPASSYLYKGDAESGELLSESTYSVTGVSPDFVVNGNKTSIKFPADIPIVSGQKYTVVIKNIFYLFEKGDIVGIYTSKAKFTDNPLILTFTGADLSNQQLYVESSSIKSGSKLKSLNELSYNISAPFDIVTGAEVSIYDNDVRIASTNNLSQSPTDQKQLNVVFDNEVIFYQGSKYSIVLPAGALNISGKPNTQSLEYTVSVEGIETKKISVKDVSHDNADKVRPDDVTISYDIPDGFTLAVPNGPHELPNVTAYLYENEINEENAVEVKGAITADGQGISWNFGKYRWKGATKYFLVKKANSIVVYDANGTYYPEFSNDEATASWTTPSREDLGLKPMEFDIPILGATEYGDRQAKYQEGMERYYMNTFSIALKNKLYYDGSDVYELTYGDARGLIEVYEITENGDKFISSDILNIEMDEDSRSFWYYGKSSWFNLHLYEGKQYRFVIPENSFSIMGRDDSNVGRFDHLKGYVYNERMEFILKGKSPNKVIVKSCNVENNSRHAKISNIVWKIDGSYRLKDDDANAIVRIVDTEGISAGQVLEMKRPILFTSRFGTTNIRIDCCNSMTGEPGDANRYGYHTFIIPKGTLINTVNEDIVNDEISVTIYGISEEEEENSKLADVEVTMNDENGSVSHATTTKGTKGRSAVVALAPDANWQVASLTHNGKKVNAVNGVYTSEPLTEDAKIVATLKFNHDVTFEGVLTDIKEVEIDGSDISIGKDGDTAVIKGLKGGEYISVYSLNGMLIKAESIENDKNTARITLPTLVPLLILVEDGTDKHAFKIILDK